MTCQSVVSLPLFLILQALQLVLEWRSKSRSMGQACIPAIAWEIHMLKCGLIGYIISTFSTSSYCRASWCQSWWNGWALAFFLEPPIIVEYVVLLKIQPPIIDIGYNIGMPIICVDHVFDAWWFWDKSHMKQSFASNTDRMTWKRAFNWFSITSFADYGGEGGPWPGASSSLLCLPCQQVTYSSIFSRQQVT